MLLRNLSLKIWATLTALFSMSAMADSVPSALERELAKIYSNARIEITGEIRWTAGPGASDVRLVRVQNETARGEVVFNAIDSATGKESSGWTTFSAWMPARVAVKRIQPGSPLSADQFKLQDINVAVGQGREFRGVILEPGVALSGLESRQTVLEGQFLLSSAVQRMPDIRRGDSVRVHVISNELSLSTSGIAQEPAYLDGSVRVTASKNKREMVGKLRTGGIVEVRL